MSTAPTTTEELRQRLEDAEATIRAISGGEVDAFLVRQGAEDQVLVLDGVDRPYRLLIERMHQGAATLTADGTIFYANRRLAEMLDGEKLILRRHEPVDFADVEQACGRVWSGAANVEPLQQGLGEAHNAPHAQKWPPGERGSVIRLQYGIVGEG